jgi:ComF family protein
MSAMPSTPQPLPPFAAAPAAAARGVGRALRAVGRAVLDVVYPSTCLACRAATDAPDALCPACWAAMRFVAPPLCARTGLPFEADVGALISPQAAADPPVCERTRCVAMFDDGPARRLVHRLKYGDAPELARPMGRWMARAGAELLADADVVVPVPLHALRLFVRRFNQAALLAQQVARESGRRLDVASLARVKATRPQVGMTHDERALNVQGAFQAAPNAFAGARVLLIDDVATTGATLNACARAALRAGARSVDALIFARVVGGRAIPI